MTTGTEYAVGLSESALRALRGGSKGTTQGRFVHALAAVYFLNPCPLPTPAPGKRRPVRLQLSTLASELVTRVAAMLPHAARPSRSAAVASLLALPPRYHTDAAVVAKNLEDPELVSYLRSAIPGLRENSPTTAYPTRVLRPDRLSVAGTNRGIRLCRSTVNTLDTWAHGHAIHLPRTGALRLLMVAAAVSPPTLDYPGFGLMPGPRSGENFVNLSPYLGPAEVYVVGYTAARYFCSNVAALAEWAVKFRRLEADIFVGHKDLYESALTELVAAHMSYSPGGNVGST